MKLCRKTVKETYLQLISGQNRSIEESNLTWKPISWRLSVRLLPWGSRRTIHIFPRYTRHCYSFKLSQLWPKNIFEIDTKTQQDNNLSCETQSFLSYIVITSRVQNGGPARTNHILGSWYRLVIEKWSNWLVPSVLHYQFPPQQVLSVMSFLACCLRKWVWVSTLQMWVKYSDDESNGTPYNLNILLPFRSLSWTTNEIFHKWC